MSETIPGNRFSWTSKLIRWCWGFGIDLWLARNTLVHASDGVVSLHEKHMIRAKISALYEHMQPSVCYRRDEIFSLSEQEMEKQPIQNQIAWLERLKYLFPESFNTIIKETVGTVRIDLERELQQLRLTGTYID